MNDIKQLHHIICRIVATYIYLPPKVRALMGGAKSRLRWASPRLRKNK